MKSTEKLLSCQTVSILQAAQPVVKNWEQRYMWQSRVEIEGYSVTHFERIAAFEVLYC